MSERPLLADRPALALRRDRALRAGLADFLHLAVADEADERLMDVNRTFTAPAVISPFPELWSNLRPGSMSVADAETLPLSSGAHDLVLDALSLHWSNDPVGQMIQARRALKPDGLYLACCFGGETLTELRTALAAAEAEIAGGLSPRVAPMGEIRDLGALIQRAGLALPVADQTRLKVSYGSLSALMHDLRAMGETNALAARHRAVPPRSLFERADALYPRDADGRLPATFDLVWLTGWSPDASQQQPLRPGSAQVRLADALGTAEEALHDEAMPGEDTGPAGQRTPRNSEDSTR
ncbi:methyltransferase domain-containing protein [Tropicimonas sp. IMCC34011]|uniref:methyltransferase domain-containing protein n=1 Tax=Tropicimonas sp. IMCC34011 TaxID=2248759 RepID=UPI000E2238CD|nr:methyltransferase domain-containing protein [Tropicimonas sp. IMCC34011]